MLIAIPELFALPIEYLFKLSSNCILQSFLLRTIVSQADGIECAPCLLQLRALSIWSSSAPSRAWPMLWDSGRARRERQRTLTLRYWPRYLHRLADNLRRFWLLMSPVAGHIRRYMGGHHVHSIFTTKKWTDQGIWHLLLARQCQAILGP